MRLHVDEKADAVYIRLDDSPIAESEEVRPGVVLDFDADGRVVGMELLRVRESLPEADLRKVQLEVA
jgi:uncharacterized protein YuzE